MDIRKMFTDRRAVHLVGWLVYMSFWLLQYSFGGTFREALAFTLFQMLFHMGAVYFNNYVIVPRFLYPKKYVLFTLSYILVIFIVGLFLYEMNYRYFYHMSSYLYNYKTVYEGITVSVFITTFAISIPTAFKINYDRMKTENKAAQLLNDKIQEELKFLKSQINPHFLFNSLNTVYHLIDQNPEEAKNTLVKFSEILRYTLYEAGNDTISLQNEFDYIKSYAAIEKIRRGKSLNVQFSEEVNGFFEVPPLMLVTFIENAFKHVSNYPTGNFIEISLASTSAELTLEVVNSVDSFKRGKPDPARQGGIGLENIRRRLELLYPNRHSLSIHEGNQKYRVELKLFTDER